MSSSSHPNQASGGEGSTASPPAGRGSSGRGRRGVGRGSGRGGSGGRGRGRSEGPAASAVPAAASTADGPSTTREHTGTPKPPAGRGGGSGRGRGGAGGGRTGKAPNKPQPPSTAATGKPPTGSKKDRPPSSKGGRGASKEPKKDGAPASDAELRRIQEEAEAALRARREAEEAAAAEAKAAEEARLAAAAAAAAAAALEAEREAAASRVRTASDALRAALEAADRHRAYRDALAPERLSEARKSFEAAKKSLKTDLKKCTAFVKKVKSGSAWTQREDDLLRDATVLNLSRYVEEVASAVLESKPKVSDLPAVVALCVAMHERYDEFLPNVLPPLWDALLGGKVGGGGSSSNAPSSDDPTKSKRLCVRLLTEFVLAGLVTDIKGLLKCVADAAGHKEGSDAYAVQDATLLVAFGKAAGFEVLGVLPRSVRVAADLLRSEKRRLDEALSETAGGEGIPVALAPADAVALGCALADKLDVAQQEQRAVKPDASDLFAKHCRGARQFLASSLVQTHARLQKLERRCEQDRLLSGTLPEAREKGLADARKLKDTLLKSVEALSDALDEDVPVLPDDDAVGGTDAGQGVEVWTKGAGEDDDLGPFDDEETRAFYCDVPDLLATVPPVLLGLSPEQVQKKKDDNAKKFGKDSDVGSDVIDESPEEVTPATEDELEVTMNELKLDEKTVDDGLGEDGDDKNTPRYKLVVLLEEELPECHRREQVDELSEKFCTNYGSNKNARKRLSKALFLVPRNRFDLLPFYSRLAATVDRVWSDVATPLVTELEQQFHGQAKFKKNQSLDSRFKTARYIGELTKFRVAPPIVFLRCLRRCLDDFTGGNVDVACCLLESCGRFLHRLQHTSARVSDLMEAMTRLSRAKNLDERFQSLIKSAFYSVKPPASVRRRIKEYPPLETYLRGLLIDRMVPTPSFVAFAAKQLVRLPWSDPSHQCGALVTRLMLKACRRGRYRTIHAIASVAARLRTQRVAGEITVRLIDAVLEELRWALENPNFRDQQRVLTYARLLGELYEANQVSGQVVNRQLFDFINLGHEIPDSLREASKRLVVSTDESSSTDAEATNQLPIYNSARSVSQTILEDEELEESALESRVDEPVPEPPKPVAVSEHSSFDPRVPSAKDPPNSAYRIKLVCTLLEVAAPSIVTRNNVPHLKGFLAAFQRYLFTKTLLPTDVEFSLLDTFDMLDSHWKAATKTKKLSDGEDGFPRYTTWLDAHNATVAYEEEAALLRAQKAEAIANLSDAKSVTYSLDGQSGRDDEEDDDTMSNFDEEDDDDGSTQSHSGSEILSDGEPDHGDNVDNAIDGEATVEDEVFSADEDELDDEEESEGSEPYSEEEDDAMDEEFDEEAYMRQLEEEAFEHELRRMTMDAIERGKNTSRKLVADNMPSGSQIAKKKGPDPTPAESMAPTTSPFALGGKEGVAFQVLKKGNKGKVEARELVVPKDTSLAVAASKKDDEAARERDEIKQRVLRYEAESAYAEESGGNVYLEQEKLQVIRNRPLSLEEIDRNFGTSGGNLKTNPDKSSTTSPTGTATAAGRRPGPGPGRGRGGGGVRGRGRGSSGRTLFR